MKPLERFEPPTKTELQKEYKRQNPNEEHWANDKYVVCVRRKLATGWGDNMTVTHLSIRRMDREAITDWRDFQWIKNQLVGEENEGFEMYPAESRLVDGANQYHLWVFDDETVRFPLGFANRSVTEKSFTGEVQRPFPDNRKPKDLKECEDKMQKQIDKFNETGEIAWD